MADLEKRLVALEDVLRRHGVYDPEMTFGQFGPHRIVIVTGTLGDVAFSVRVQQPELVDLDDEVIRTRVEQNQADTEAFRADMRRRLAEGRSFFDDEGEPS